jgi:hypothetical protein
MATTSPTSSMYRPPYVNAASCISATTPATNGDAMLVPLIVLWSRSEPSSSLELFQVL